MKFSSNGVEAYLQKITTPGPVAVAITALSNAKPAVATFGAVTTFADGDVVLIKDTGTPLDGRAFIADSVDTPVGTVTLLGSDLSANTTTVTTGTATPIPAADLLKFCLTTLERAQTAADSIDVSTMCGPESLAGIPLPGDLKLEGFQNFDEAAYIEFLKATQDGVARILDVKLPIKAGVPAGGTPPNRHIIYNMTATGITETFAVNEAAAFAGEGVLTQLPTYVLA